jgi:poly-gamma-glutamate synthesis protein (capsule biosynthesis protein)
MKWILLVFTLGTVVFLGITFLNNSTIVETFPSSDENPVQEEQTVRVALVGDVMLDRGVEYIVGKEGNDNFNFPFLKIGGYLKEVDLFFCNLESLISDKGTEVGSIYSFRAEPEAIEGLSFAGFDIVSLANNHAFDYGKEALKDTFLRLNEAGIDFVGAGLNETEAFSAKVKEVEGVKIGFLAYTNLGPESWGAGEDNTGIAWISENDIEKVKEDIRTAKEKVDVLIISLHSGKEYVSKPAQFQVDFSEACIEAGADLVVGHHPHVVQPKKQYKQGWIFYSVGNFVFDQSFSEETMKGQIVEVLIEKGEIKEVIPVNIKINKLFQPEIER